MIKKREIDSSMIIVAVVAIVGIIVLIISNSTEVSFSIDKSESVTGLKTTPFKIIPSEIPYKPKITGPDELDGFDISFGF